MSGESGERAPGRRRTPLFAQYHRIKAEHPDALLLFRLGDFYELFYEDAERAARLLDIALTSRNRGEDDEVPLCGFPCHAAQPHIARLLAAGERVAICEQLEAATPARKGLLPRAVVRVITAGTVLDEAGLEPTSPSFLAAVCPAEEGTAAGRADDARYGLAVLDFSTGLFRVTEVAGSGALGEELSRIAPRELLVPQQVAQTVGVGQGWVLTPLPAERFDSAPLERWLAGRAGEEAAWRSRWPVAARAAGALLGYLDETHHGTPAHLRVPEPYRVEAYCQIDGATRRNLELLETLRGERRGSLLWVLDRTHTPVGARTLRSWIIYPLLDLEEIGRRLDAVEELMGDLARRGELSAALSGMGDLERLAGRVGAGSAGPRDLAQLRGALERVERLRAVLDGARSALLTELAGALEPLPQIRELIGRALEDSPPVQARAGGFIRPGYSREVDELRAASREGKSWIARLEARERERTGIASLKVRYSKVFGYSIEVTRPNLHLVPADYERRQTLVGAERFVTPELKEQEARVLGAEERLTALEVHLFGELVGKVAAHEEALGATAAAVGVLDAVVSLAEVAHHRGYVRPQVTRGLELEIEDGRHPVVEAVDPGSFVPNDTHLDPAREQVLILTGPNMAGKSTYLRQVALIALLAQMGSFVPAATARVGLVDRIFTRVGASDNLAGGESTFMVEMRETARILAGLTPRSLVVLDEIGRGTSTFDGISIARAVAEYLHDAPERPRTLFATHYHELTALAAARERVRNLAVAVREWKGEVVFLRRVLPGAANRSYGVEVAKLAGIPAPIVARARELLAEMEGDERRQARTDGPQRGVQLPLFSSPATEIERELQALEPERLTPIEALATLARLVELARSGGGAGSGR